MIAKRSGCRMRQIKNIFHNSPFQFSRSTINSTESFMTNKKLWFIENVWRSTKKFNLSWLRGRAGSWECWWKLPWWQKNGQNKSRAQQRNEMYKHNKNETLLITDNLKVNNEIKQNSEDTNCIWVLDTCQEIHLQQQLHFNLYLLGEKAEFTANNKFTNWEQYFFICFANGRFYVYLKRNLIAFEFVSFLWSGVAASGAIVKGNRDIIINFYLIYFAVRFIKAKGRRQIRYSTKTKGEDQQMKNYS